MHYSCRKNLLRLMAPGSLVFFLVMPRLRSMDVSKSMLWGFVGLVVSQVILIAVPTRNYVLLLVATVLEACSTPIATTPLEKLVVLVVDAKERARIMAIVYMVVIVFTSPFGWIAGRMSEINRSLPFVLMVSLFTIGVLLTFLTTRLRKETGTAVEVAVEQA